MFKTTTQHKHLTALENVFGWFIEVQSVLQCTLLHLNTIENNKNTYKQSVCSSNLTKKCISCKKHNYNQST